MGKISASSRQAGGSLGTQAQEGKSVAIIKLPSLRPGQRKLYELIVSKLDTEEKITLKEATQIWLSRVHRDKARDGTPLRWDYYHERHEDANGRVTFSCALVRMTPDEIAFSVLNWLMKNIGLLVIRGYLKVIPQVDLEAAEVIEAPKLTSEPQSEA